MCGGQDRRCISTSFSSHGIQYSRVCGKIIGYQFGRTNAFNKYYLDQTVMPSLSSLLSNTNLSWSCSNIIIIMKKCTYNFMYMSIALILTLAVVKIAAQGESCCQTHCGIIDITSILYIHHIILQMMVAHVSV